MIKTRRIAVAACLAALVCSCDRLSIRTPDAAVLEFFKRVAAGEYMESMSLWADDKSAPPPAADVQLAGRTLTRNGNLVSYRITKSNPPGGGSFSHQMVLMTFRDGSEELMSVSTARRPDGSWRILVMGPVRQPEQVALEFLRQAISADYGGAFRLMTSTQQRSIAAAGGSGPTWQVTCDALTSGRSLTSLVVASSTMAPNRTSAEIVVTGKIAGGTTATFAFRVLFEAGEAWHLDGPPALN